MAIYKCSICGAIYDESKEKILFNNLPDDWICPLCNDTKEEFELIEENIEDFIVKIIVYFIIR